MAYGQWRIEYTHESEANVIFVLEFSLSVSFSLRSH